MADKKISELTPATAINQADVSILVSGGTDYKFAFSTLLQFIGNNLSVGANISFGTTLPQNTSGKNGDLFVNTTTGAFAQKLSGTWAVVYTVPVNNTQTDSTVLYGSGIPGPSTGSNGDTYINTGTGVFYKKASGAWSQVFSMQTGPQGPQGVAGVNGVNGTNGFSILNGTTNPSNLSTGVNGDFYLNTSNYFLFGPKAGGVWGEGISLIPAGLSAGGTTGQALVKTGNNDYDTGWKTLDISFAALMGKPSDNTSLDTALSTKVDKATGYSLSQENYTAAEKTKLANLEEHYVGYYTTLSGLQAAHPSGLAGQYATVDSGIGAEARLYIWDDDDNSWILGSGSGNVTSVNGQIGAVSLSTDDIGEGSNPAREYFTAARALATLMTGYSASSGPVSAADTILSSIQKIDGNTASKAPLTSPAFTGTPSAPTPPAGDSSTKIATTAFVTSAVTTSGNNYKISYNFAQSVL